MLLLLIDFPRKLKFEKTHGILITLFYVSLFSYHLDWLSSLKNQENYSSASDWWEHTKSLLKKKARTFSEKFTTQENIRISRLKKRLRNLYNKENLKPEIKTIIKNLQDKLIGK